MDFALEPLEYDRLKALLGRYLSGPAARELLGAMAPSTDREALEARHALVAEAMAYLRDRTIRFPEIPALPAVLERLGPGGITLAIPEIEAVQDLVADIVGLKAGWGELGREFPLLAREFRRLPDVGALGILLGRAVRGGEIQEDFSPGLKRLRRDLEVARARLDRKLQAILKKAAGSGQLQDELVTIRNGRFVIPVRAEQQRSVPGVVHGSSSSGATVFMEPLETLEMNNDLVRIAEEEEREIARILGELTDAIQERREDVGVAVGVRGELELLFGVARWGRDFDCVTPRFSRGEIWLRSARHPLLEDRLRSAGERVVPLNLDMDAGERVLVISGPNAGGKTVVLKTLGLFSLMAQSGLPVPASDARVPLADRVLADIGDRQSIANQLSTFSAHVLEISRMAEAAGPDSLILLDEIGSSTEPAEGAALGIAVLEHFRKARARTVATTHYNRLKMYAETTGGVRNAAMAFDEETLEPTYALVHGLAGPSSGLKIAGRLHLRKEILDEAWSSLDTGEIDAARFVEELKARIADLEAETARLGDERRGFEAWKDEMIARIETERTRQLADLERRLDELVDDIRRRAEDSLRASGSDAGRRLDRMLDRARREARQTLRSEVLATETGPAPAEPAGVTAGSRVKVLSLGVEGVVLEVRGHQAEVSVGRMKVQRPFEDLEVVEVPALRLPVNVEFDSGRKDDAPSELNVIGCSRDEALERLDKFLDDAILTGFPSVRVIHGTGRGILRRAVAGFLETHPHVSGFETAPPEQGGAGVTIVGLSN